MKVKILIPIYNDWQSLIKILENINTEIVNFEHDFSVIIVNDASTENRPEIFANIGNFSFVKIINMKENKGHARCNASGLKYIFEKEEFDYVIPMDGDGEDRPEEIKLLLKKMSENPEKVSWLHIDLNSAEATISALEFFYERIVNNGIILFDDYGGFEKTRIKIDNFFSDKRGHFINFPTGQGIFYKKH